MILLCYCPLKGECDWHYWDNRSEFPTVMEFAKNGHKVLGATWKDEKTIKTDAHL